MSNDFRNLWQRELETFRLSSRPVFFSASRGFNYRSGSYEMPGAIDCEDTFTVEPGAIMNEIHSKLDQFLAKNNRRPDCILLGPVEYLRARGAVGEVIPSRMFGFPVDIKASPGISFKISEQTAIGLAARLLNRRDRSERQRTNVPQEEHNTEGNDSGHAG